MSTIQIYKPTTKEGFIEEFNNSDQFVQKWLLEKAGASKYDLADFAVLDAQEVAMNFIDGQDVMADVLNILEECDK